MRLAGLPPLSPHQQTTDSLVRSILTPCDGGPQRTRPQILLNTYSQIHSADLQSPEWALARGGRRCDREYVVRELLLLLNWVGSANPYVDL